MFMVNVYLKVFKTYFYLDCFQEFFCLEIKIELFSREKKKEENKMLGGPKAFLCASQQAREKETPVSP